MGPLKNTQINHNIMIIDATWLNTALISLQCNFILHLNVIWQVSFTIKILADQLHSPKCTYIFFMMAASSSGSLKKIKNNFRKSSKNTHSYKHMQRVWGAHLLLKIHKIWICYKITSQGSNPNPEIPSHNSQIPEDLLKHQSKGGFTHMHLCASDRQMTPSDVLFFDRSDFLREHKVDLFNIKQWS